MINFAALRRTASAILVNCYAKIRLNVAESDGAHSRTRLIKHAHQIDKEKVKVQLNAKGRVAESRGKFSALFQLLTNLKAQPEMKPPSQTLFWLVTQSFLANLSIRPS